MKRRAKGLAKGLWYALRGWFDLRRARLRGLDRFILAQASITYDRALEELRQGEKRTHWMWFIFPQGKGLGTSYRSKLYALSHWEARRYLADPILGPRLRQCVHIVQDWRDRGRTPEQIFGELDAMKYRSCLDLFFNATGEITFRG